MDAFTATRQFIASNAQIFQRLYVMEQNQLALPASTRLRTQNRQRYLQRCKETDQIMSLHTNVYRHIYLRFSGTVSVVPDTGSGCNPLRSTSKKA